MSDAIASFVWPFLHLWVWHYGHQVHNVSPMGTARLHHRSKAMVTVPNNTLNIGGFHRAKFGREWFANFYYAEGDSYYGVYHDSRAMAQRMARSNVAPHVVAYRIRVIKRDPKTYLDRLIAAAEARWCATWQDRGEDVDVEGYRRETDILNSLHARKAAQRHDDLVNRRMVERHGPNEHPADMTEAVADAMLKGVL